MKKLLVFVMVMALMLSATFALTACFGDTEREIVAVGIPQYPTIYKVPDSTRWIAKEGDPFSLEGLVLEIMYDNGDTETVDESSPLFENIRAVDENGNDITKLEYIFPTNTFAGESGYAYSNMINIMYGDLTAGSYIVEVFPPYLGEYRIISKPGMTATEPSTTGFYYLEIGISQVVIDGSVLDEFSNSWGYTAQIPDINYLISLNNQEDIFEYDATTGILTSRRGSDSITFGKIDDTMCTVTLRDGTDAIKLIVDRGTAVDLDYIRDFLGERDDFEIPVTLDGEPFDWSTVITSDITLDLAVA